MAGRPSWTSVESQLEFSGAKRGGPQATDKVGAGKGCEWWTSPPFSRQPTEAQGGMSLPASQWSNLNWHPNPHVPWLLYAQRSPEKAITLFSWGQVCPLWAACKFQPFSF